MKKTTKIYLALSVAGLIGVTAIADSAHEPAGQSNGSAEAMRTNINYPNATVPAKDNGPDYERIKNGVAQRIETCHPEKSLSNTYNSTNYSK